MPKSYFFWSFLLLTAVPCFASDTLPRNTKLEVRLDETLGSDISQVGQSFTATVSRSIPLGGKESLQKGAQVSGVVKYAESTMHYYQPGQLELQLTAVATNGRVYHITTNTLRFHGKERRMDPTTGKQDDRGARAEDIARAGIGVIGANTTPPSQTIPGTDISAGASTPATGMQVVLPAKSKLTFTITASD